ncbi:hypothetical protein EYZ11_012591 [Aspergillus tanneri]|uniref:Carrier domain-containing protein n=1 Tax=Aspergillus tanneri TaxID=1220188 RepID=A0A4V3UMN3_9EURO|nr:hypothetical protein EYZ11_012591 [Aspergillus tanneri]
MTAMPGDPVYAVFTSGSTGKPKGVVIQHSSFCSSALGHGKLFGLSSGSRVFQFSSHAFDVSITDHLTTLIMGGCICVPSENDRQNCPARAANDLGVTFADLTPSVARMLCPSRISTMKTVVLSGEVVTATDLELLAIGPTIIRVMNSYGPAECAVKSTLNCDVRPVTDPQNIGKAVGGICWVVNSNNHEKLVPIGAVGELLIEGSIVGSGYLCDPAKSSAVFIQAPSWLRRFRAADYTGRLYKTGDLVQYVATGELRYIGRKDTQVKLRGQRLELGEVEHQTQKCFPSAHQVVAEIIIPVVSGRQPSLVAFVFDGRGSRQAADPNALSNSALFGPPDGKFASQAVAARLHLPQTLPTYMVPSAFVPLTQLPLTPSGKVDRHLLREAAASLSQEQLTAYTTMGYKKRSPSTENEKKLQRVWASVLHLDMHDIGKDDSFIPLGGDSITAMSMVSAARNEGLHLTVYDVFQNKQLYKLAQQNTSIQPIDGSCKNIPWSWANCTSCTELFESHIAPSLPFSVKITDVLPTTECQQYSLNTQAFTYFRLHIRGGANIQRVKSACTALVERHAILRTMFVPYQNRDFVQVVLRRMEVPLKICCGRDIGPLAYARLLCEAGCLNPPHIAVPPLHFTLVAQGKDAHVLVIRISHAQYDGISLPILLGDLAGLCDKETLVSPVTDFPMYVRQRYAQRSNAAVNFWRRTLDGSSMTVLSLSPGPGFTLQDTPVKTSGEVRISHSSMDGITIATVVKAAWSWVLFTHSGQTDVVFGQLVSGRNFELPGIDRVVGSCLNITPGLQLSTAG